MSDKRNTNGTFAPGNPGGPGRPRRAVEAEYLGVVACVVTLERWQRIVEAACCAAESGDDRARGWLSSFVLGDSRPSLWDIARRDMQNVSVDDELAAQMEIDKTTSADMLALGAPNALEAAIATAQAKRDEASGAAERERRATARLVKLELVKRGLSKTTPRA